MIKLPELQKQIYKLIVERFIAIFYPPAEFNKVNVTVNVENETFYETGKVCVKQGYREILKKEFNVSSKDNNVGEASLGDSQKDNETNKKDETNIEILNTLKKGQIVYVKNFELERC